MRDWTSILEHSSPADLGWSADRPAPQVARTALYRILRKRAGRVAAPDAPTSLSSADVVREAGITFRQLDYWARTGRLAPTDTTPAGRAGQGFHRQWTKGELAVARLLGRLTAAGLPLETAVRIARSGEPRSEIAPGIWIEVAP